MMITQWQILAVLRRILSRTPYVSDYIKASDGRIVRFVNWKEAAR